MPRIRTLKPEHRQHRKIGPLTDRQYRLWVGMVCEADDHGRLVAEPEQLRVIIWGYQRKVKASHVAEALDVLALAGLVTLYRVEGVLYAAFTSWTDHQKVDHPTNSRLPGPPLDGSREFASVRGGSEGSDRKDRIGEEGGSPLLASDPAIANGGPPAFKIAPSILEAIDKCRRLGQAPKLKTAAYWQALIRAYPGVDLPPVILDSEAYLTTHPNYKDLPDFLRGSVQRAYRRITA